MTKASRLVQKQAEQMQASFAQVGSAAKLVGGTVAAAFAGVSFVGIVRASIDAMDALNDFADATGSTVGKISALEDVAARTGTSMDTVSTALVKFNSSLNAASVDSPIARSLKAIGLSAAELKRQDPSEALLQVAGALGKFSDDGNKARLVQEYFGKSVKEVAPFLKDLADKGKLVATTTAEQTKQAEDFNKQLFNLQKNTADTARAFTSQYLPALNAVISAYNNGGLKGAANALGERIGLGAEYYERQGLDRLKGQVSDLESEKRRLETVLKINPESPLAAALDKVNAKLGVQKAAFDAARVSYLRLVPGNAGRGRAAYPEFDYRETVGDQGAQKKEHVAKDDPAKALLENRVRAIQDSLKQQQDAEADFSKSLEGFNQRNLVSFEEYFALRKQAADGALAELVSGFDKEIAERQAYQASLGAGHERERAEEQTKIDDVRRKSADAVAKARREEQAQTGVQAGMVTAYRLSLDALNASALEAAGNLKEAAGVRFDLANAELMKRLDVEGNEEDKRKLQGLREIQVAQAEFNQLQIEATRITETLQIAEERIQRSRELGALSELEALIKLGEERSRAAAQLRVIAAAETSTAVQSKDPRLTATAARATEEAEKLAAQAQPLADKFNAVFRDSTNSGLADFISGTKSASAAFTDFSNAVVSQISRIAAQSLTDAIFGKSSSGGLGGLLSKLFPATAKKLPVTDLASANGNVFDAATLHGYGDGKVGVLGEAGPEAVMPLARGKNGKLGIVASGGGGGSNVINQYFTVGDVASMAQVRMEVNRAQRAGQSALARSREYGGAG